MKKSSLMVTVAVVAASCTGGSAESTSSSTPDPNSTPSSTVASLPAVGSVPNVDLTTHSVPLEEILFDTFDGHFISLSDADPELIASLRDAISPIDEPRYGGPEAGGWLESTDLVLGYETKSQAYAYPLKILDLHEIVNDELGGTPVLISYCPLCRSAVVFARTANGEVLDFGNTSALYESDLVMLDRQTGSYWWQVAGEAIVGTLTGTRLAPLPSRVDTWADWLGTHPETLVLEPPGGSPEPYTVDRFAAYEQFLDAGGSAFPVNRLDNRLAASELVIGVEVSGSRRAYPVESLGRAAVNDVLADTPLAVFSKGPVGGAVYRRMLGGETLTFTEEDGRFRDAETGSGWDFSGRAVAGPLRGSALEPLPSHTTFWFAYAGAFPDTDVYQP